MASIRKWLSIILILFQAELLLCYECVAKSACRWQRHDHATALSQLELPFKAKIWSDSSGERPRK
uniref:RxLR effector candidate protein n=1 Tax=Hyaloperonospora arabidopsidis (strain Emoy2) TaxID=559515 RepID=M4B7J5_HYAAE